MFYFIFVVNWEMNTCDIMENAQNLHAEKRLLEEL